MGKPTKPTTAQLRERVSELDKQNKALRGVLNEIVNMYVANRGSTNSEFIVCITPEHSSEMTPIQRRKNKVWSLFDRARILLGE